MSELGRILGIAADARTFKQNSGLVLPECRIGVECEFENVQKALPPSPELRYWTPHAEHSLRNNGQEYVFSEPLFGEDACRAVEWILREAKRAGYKTSIRTGLHVHVDARDLDVSQLRNFCILYAYVEPVLFQWVGDNREESVYCVPWYYADRSIEKAGKLLAAAVADSRQPEDRLSKIRPYNGPGMGRTTAAREEREDRGHASLTAQVSASYERYAAFNLNALHKFGSIEFRHMQMTLDYDRTMMWINLLLSLKKAAMAPGDIYARILKETPIDFFNSTFGTKLFAELMDACKGKFKESVGLGHQSCADMVRFTRSRSWESPIPRRLSGVSKGGTLFAQRFGSRTKKKDLNTVKVEKQEELMAAPTNFARDQINRLRAQMDARAAPQTIAGIGTPLGPNDYIARW